MKDRIGLSCRVFRQTLSVEYEMLVLNIADTCGKEDASAIRDLNKTTLQHKTTIKGEAKKLLKEDAAARRLSGSMTQIQQ
jgi:hypothetical protein